MARGTLPDGAYHWLHAKQVYAAIGRVLALYRPGGCHGCRRRRRDGNTHKTQLLASVYRTFLLTKLSYFVTRKGPPTQLIEATSFVKIKVDMRVARELS
jgi:hypothetical protein